MDISQIKEQQIKMVLDFGHYMAMAVDLGNTTEAEDRQEAEDLLLRLKFAPMGDNHHNAKMCPYCSSETR